MNSLDVKVNIAEKQGHPKLYLWTKKWEKKSTKNCQQTLIDLIQYQQSAVNARLETIDAEITGELKVYGKIKSENLIE